MSLSKKVFAVLSVALPLMLVISMAHAEGPGTQCPNLDRQREECNAKHMSFTEPMLNTATGCREVKCTEGATVSSSSFSSSASSFVCPNIDEMIRKCGDRGYTTLVYRDCKVAQCKEPPKPMMNEGVICKRTKVDGCLVFTCADGMVQRVCSTSNSSTSTSTGTSSAGPMGVGPCSDIEKMVKDAKAKLEASPNDTSLSQTLNDLTKRWNECRQKNNLPLPPPTGGILSSCTSKKDATSGCMIRTCGMKITRICPRPEGGSSSSHQ